MKNRVFFWLIIIILLIPSCKKGKKIDNIYTDEIAKIVSQVTNGKIGFEDKIMVHFVNSVSIKEILNSEIKDEIFDFSPSIKGKAYWTDFKTLVFEPTEPLPFRKVYQGELYLKKLCEDFKKENKPDLKFSFEVLGRELSSFEGELVLKNRNSPVLLNYKGKVIFSEKTKFDDVKDEVSLKYGMSKVQLNWKEETDKKIFVFESDDITRDKSTKNFVLQINKGKLDLSQDFEKEFELAPIEDMKVVEVTTDEKNRSPQVRLEFSDDFDPEQDLNGLIITEPKLSLKLQKLGKFLVLNGSFKFGNEYSIVVETGIRSRWATTTKEKFIKKVKFSDIKPQVEFASDGVFLPSNNQYKLQFYSANLKRVHIEVKKVYDKGVGEFLRTEKLNSLKDRKTGFEGSYINRVGVIVHNETFEIGNEKNTWLLNEIDLSKVIKDNNPDLLLIRLNFNPRDMLADVTGEKDNYIEEFGQIYKPLIFSDLGMTCKITDDQIIVFVTDINTCKPLSNVKVTLKSYYDRDLVTEETNSEGIAKFTRHQYWDEYIEAEKNGQKSVIKLNEMEWNISGFDIGGIDENEQETKAFIYTERGVYRPGDEINISAIARFKDQQYPDNHPVTLEMFNPQGKKVYTVSNKANTDGFYNFTIQTKEGDLTGSWSANFNLGNREFSKEIKIETFVPYKLKVKIEPKDQIIYWGNKKLIFDLACNYLFGNPAANLSSQVDLEINMVNKAFPKYSNFIFSNPCLDFKEIQENIFEGNLDENGKQHIDWDIPSLDGVPSALNIKLTAKVLEKGGRPNINWVNIPLNPYSHYVGLQAPQFGYVNTGNDTEIPVIVVDNDGNAVAGKTLKYRIYRNSSYWWWQYDNERKLRFKTDNSTVLIKEGTITSKQTHSKIQFLPIDEGFYLVEVSDEAGTGHSSGILISAFPYGGNANGDKNAGTLPLHGDKNKYFTGETAKIQFPAAKDGLVLLTVEKENKILDQKWYYPEKDEQMTLEIPVTDEMVPNAYISVSLIQPHSQTKNDRPIRMFGILPLMVEDKDTRQEIEILTSSQFRPLAPFEITVQTTNHRQTQFTIAVVDEGILDITQFQTPDPWKYFFQKTRLQVRTFDLFSLVINANKGDVFKTFSIGGDMDYRESQSSPEKGKRRFKPVSMFKGPLKTDSDGKAVVKFEMPEYVGSVRIMVIGATENSYARAEKSVPVKSELMLISTLPRVLGPSENISVPITVFAMQDNIGKVNVEITAQGPVDINGSKIQVLNFGKASDKDCYFNLQTKPEAGQSKVIITAKSDKFFATNTVDLMIRPTSPRIYTTTEGIVMSGQKSLINVPGIGIKGTNRAKLTISKFPLVNFSHRVEWLMHYPYGCIEQTTSSVFPQLYLKKFIEYPEANTKKIDAYINAGIQRLRTFQVFSGGFSYWPYGDNPSEWGTLYAGHFMVEAKKLGYYIENDLYTNWINYVKEQARNSSGDLMTRVYRVYLLALCGNAELPEMNLLKENLLKDMNNTQKWLLASAYSINGLPDKGDEIIKNVGFETKVYNEFSGTFGSGLRDKAMILDAMVGMKKINASDKLAREISKSIAATNWYSTQTIGYSLLALGKYINEINQGQEDIQFTGNIVLSDGSKVLFNTSKSFSLDINNGFGKPLEINFDNNPKLPKAFTTLNWDGVPLISNIKDESSKLSLDVKWYSDNGTIIDPTIIKQGTTFWGHFQVANKSEFGRVDEIALVQILPSGWEVENVRLLNESLPTWAQSLTLHKEEYLDIQDDRIMWFFDLDNSSDYESLDFIIKLNAVTVGEFNLPATIVEAMYNGQFKATKAGKKVKVIKP